MGVFSDLNLNGTTASRVQPKVGPWGPVNVPSTRHKNWLRILAPVVFLAALTAIVAFATWIYQRFLKPGAEQAQPPEPAGGGFQLPAIFDGVGGSILLGALGGLLIGLIVFAVRRLGRRRPGA